MLIPLLVYRKILNESTIKDFHLSQKFLIIVNERVENLTESLNGIFGILWTNGLIDSHVLAPDNENADSWTLYTYLPYQTDCFSLTQIKVATFTPFNSTDNMTLSIDELYPSKLKSFFNCPLYYAPSNAAPFVIFRNDSDGHHVFEGIDISLIQGIAKLLKFSVVYKCPSRGTGHGVVLENGTAFGNMGLVRL